MTGLPGQMFKEHGSPDDSDNCIHNIHDSVHDMVRVKDDEQHKQGDSEWYGHCQVSRVKTQEVKVVGDLLTEVVPDCSGRRVEDLVEVIPTVTPFIPDVLLLFFNKIVCRSKHFFEQALYLTKSVQFKLSTSVGLSVIIINCSMSDSIDTLHVILIVKWEEVNNVTIILQLLNCDEFVDSCIHDL